MKKLLFFLLCSVVLFSACSKADSNQLNVPKAEYTVDPNGGLVEVFFQANDNLEIEYETAQEWVSLPQTKSLNLNMLVFQCKPNDTFAQRDIRIKLFVANSNLQQYINIKQLANTDTLPKIKSFSFLVKDNPDKLLSDVHANFINDSTISVRIPYILVDKKLKPTIIYDGTLTKISQEEDFTAPIKYSVANNTRINKDYTVYVNSYNGLPVVTIETENRYINPDKNIYVKGSVSIDSHTDFPQGFAATTRFKGRGNATWTYDKKPYRLKLDAKASIFNMPEDKDWVLLAGHCDMSLMRLDLFFEVSRIFNMDWTPRMEFVDLFLNGKYEGNYMFGEHVKTAQGRLEVEELDGGMLIEEDGYYISEPKWFKTAVWGLGYSFKTPDADDITDEQLSNCKAVIEDFETRLSRANFKDPINGYKAVIDVENFAAWWLVQNITKNIDTNRYFYKKNKQSKLCMGPVWDAEWSLGLGVFENYEWVKGPTPIDGWVLSPYFVKMVQDEQFLAVVKQVWDKNKENIKISVIEKINKNYQRLLYSQESNYVRWNELADFTSYGNVALTTFNNEVQYVKDFFLKRYQWLDSEISKF